MIIKILLKNVLVVQIKEGEVVYFKMKQIKQKMIYEILKDFVMDLNVKKE